jgi:NADH:ubiquinone oxidoreductase subunit 3 (subunit A)
MDLLLSPPIAFLLYIPLVLAIVAVGRALAGPENPNPMKSSIYGSGEEAPSFAAAPGYRPFFLIAFFFAFLHLGALVLGTGQFTWMMGAYLVGLLLALTALILG